MSARQRVPKEGSLVRTKLSDSDEWQDGVVDVVLSAQFAVVYEDGRRELVLFNGSIEWKEVT